jgi:hypothetical protein
MTKLADRLFHRNKHAAVTTPAPAPERVPAMSGAATAPPPAPAAPLTGVDRWAIAPTGVCDVCNTGLDGLHGRRVPAAQFTRAVQRGYNPFASGRASSSMAVMFGISAGDAYTDWRAMALGVGAASDWALCDDCAKDLSGYIATH